MRTWAVAGFVALAGALGGGSQGAPLRLAAVELAGVGLGAVALFGSVRTVWRGQAWAAALIGLLIALPLLQLAPLPPAVWQAAPGHAVRAQALALIGVAPGWAPLSLDPAGTLQAVLALIPPLALFAATLALPPERRRIVAGIWLTLAAAGLVLGLVQLSGPAAGPAYLHRYANFGSLVGVFANRNHEAALLVALIPVAAALTAPAAARDASRRRQTSSAASVAGAWLAGLFVPLALVALAVVRSRAGVLLAAPAVLGAGAVLAGARVRGLGLAALGGGVLAAAAAAAVFAASPLIDRFVGEVGSGVRLDIWRQVIVAAAPVEPLGSGIGSFERVYRAAEPLAMIGPTFLNHAHNDFLEVWLEAGWAGVALILLFLAWFVARSWRAWRGRADPLTRGASVCVALLLAHSVVDYPLRTPALACLFAFACACLAAGGSPRAERR